MRILIVTFLAMTAASTFAASQQQCEALMKPVEAKLSGMPKLDDDSKPSPQTCARGRDVIKNYVDYAAQADKLNCPFAFVSGQQIGGAAERADLIADMKKAYSEKCR
ncbi:hypothetical protein [Noviherbaspirillum galbum]|nr:hypothetical protein [Noviherbaspirillum galbum]